MDAEAKLLDLRRQDGIEPQHLSASPHAGEAPQYHVHCSSHCPQVDAFRGGSALYVGDVTVQRLLQEAPGLVRVVSRQYPGAHDRAKRGAVRSTRQVVVDRTFQLLVCYLVAEACE